MFMLLVPDIREHATQTHHTTQFDKTVSPWQKMRRKYKERDEWRKTLQKEEEVDGPKGDNAKLNKTPERIQYLKKLLPSSEPHLEYSDQRWRHFLSP
jgi:hypothetical protein